MIKVFTRFWKLDHLIKPDKFKAGYRGSMFIMVLLMGVVLIVSCEDEGGTLANSPGMYITGPQIATPETKASFKAYAIDVPTGTVTWEVESGTATITAGADNTAEVNFGSNGQVVITASNGTLTAWYAINVSAIDPIFSVAYAVSGVVNNGGKDTIFFSFDAALAAAPTLYLNGTNAADTSGFFREGDDALDPFNSPGETLSALASYKSSEKVYFAIYTGGTGKGQPEARLDNIVVKANYGGATATNKYVLLPSLDNTSPVGNVMISKAVANMGTEVTITATFNEAVRPTMITPADTLVFIDIAGGGVTAERDTLWATGNPAVWSMTYKTTGTGDGNMTATVVANTIVDLGGNAATTISLGSLMIDNTDPSTAGSTASALGDLAVQITATPDISWLVLAAGATAPTTLAEFAPGGKGTQPIVVNAAGNYDIYFIAVDEAGNSSAIGSQLGLVVTN